MTKGQLFGGMAKKKSQMFVYSDHALSDTKLVHRQGMILSSKKRGVATRIFFAFGCHVSP